jgi:hypothetical protein
MILGDDRGGKMTIKTIHAASVEHYDHWVKLRGPIADPLLWTHAQYLIVRHRRQHRALAEG